MQGFTCISYFKVIPAGCGPAAGSSSSQGYLFVKCCISGAVSLRYIKRNTFYTGSAVRQVARHVYTHALRYPFTTCLLSELVRVEHVKCKRCPFAPMSRLPGPGRFQAEWQGLHTPEASRMACGLQGVYCQISMTEVVVGERMVKKRRLTRQKPFLDIGQAVLFREILVRNKPGVTTRAT